MANGLGASIAKLLQGIRRGEPARTKQPEQTKQPARATSTSNGRTHVLTAPSADISFDGVTIEYNPDLDGDADPGEVVWTWVPWEEDPTQGKDRPVVIVGHRGLMLVGVPLTSKPHDNEHQIAVGTGPWDRDGRVSYAKLDRILEVDPSQVRREGSILDRRHFDAIVAALRTQ